jgi:DNA invertase Pin-like site-specific DNA recombinase
MAIQRRAVIYTRCTPDAQTNQNQLLQLRGHAERMGYEIVAELTDWSISGAKGKSERAAYKRLCAIIARREVDMIVCWSVDRLSRSLTDLLQFLQEIQAKRVDLFLHQQALDTSTPSGKAMFQLLNVFTDLHQSVIAERMRAGIENARRQGKRLGRPSVASSPAVVASVRALRERGMSVHAIAKTLRIGVGTTQKILAA